jgi:hypothetical protein
MKAFAKWTSILIFALSFSVQAAVCEKTALDQIPENTVFTLLKDLPVPSDSTPLLLALTTDGLMCGLDVGTPSGAAPSLVTKGNLTVQFLSNDDAWDLYKGVAFGENQDVVGTFWCTKYGPTGNQFGIAEIKSALAPVMNVQIDTLSCAE